MSSDHHADLASEIHDQTGADTETERLVLDAYHAAYEREHSGSGSFEAAVDAFARRFPACSRSVAYRRVAEIISAAEEADCRAVSRSG